MKRILRRMAYVLAGFWAIFSFLASNNPSEVKSRIVAWGNERFIVQFLEVMVEIAGSTFALAATFFLFGVITGWKIVEFRGKRVTSKLDDDWAWNLSLEMENLIHQIDRIGWAGNTLDIAAQANVIAIKCSQKGLKFPNPADGFDNFEALLPYLHQISAFLKAGQVDEARSAALHLGKKPLP